MTGSGVVGCVAFDGRTSDASFITHPSAHLPPVVETGLALAVERLHLGRTLDKRRREKKGRRVEDAPSESIHDDPRGRGEVEKGISPVLSGQGPSLKQAPRPWNPVVLDRCSRPLRTLNMANREREGRHGQLPHELCG